jgi:hypothetical protein
MQAPGIPKAISASVLRLLYRLHYFDVSLIFGN